MTDLLTAPNVGTGPHGVEHDASDGFYYLTLHGTRTGKSYPLGKTAYRTARKLNDEHGPEAVPGFLEDPEPKATAPAPKPKAPKPAPTPKAPPKIEEPGKVFKGTREEWLNGFIAAARPVFKAHGLELPEKIRASVGFMFRGGKAIGQCWHEASSTDGTREIFVIPTLDDSARIADVLTHELCHTLFGPDEKHGKNFKAAVTKLGLEGKATATVAGPGWLEWAGPILEDLGRIPHAAIDPALSGVKKQKTYLLKCECEECGLIFRATAKAINGKTLRCTDADCDGLVKVEGAEETGE
jgi:predicted SprT family Zn-dependent metalloprotease